jgi:hypothetical protein
LEGIWEGVGGVGIALRDGLVVCVAFGFRWRGDCFFVLAALIAMTGIVCCRMTGGVVDGQYREREMEDEKDGKKLGNAGVAVWYNSYNGRIDAKVCRLNRHLDSIFII